MALVLDGNGTMTVGNGDITGLATGALEATAIGSGAILQALHYTMADTQVSWTGTNIYTGFQGSITPKSSSSKILAICNLNCISTSGQGRLEFYIRWNGTSGDNSGTLSTNSAWLAFSVSAGITSIYGGSFSDLVTPNTTSTLYFKLCSTKHDGGTAYINYYNEAGPTLTLLEIAG